MRPLLLANWRLIHLRFCLLIWLVATALAVAIVVHFAGATRACAGAQGDAGSSRLPALTAGPGRHTQPPALPRCYR